MSVGKSEKIAHKLTGWWGGCQKFSWNTWTSLKIKSAKKCIFFVNTVYLLRFVGQLLHLLVCCNEKLGAQIQKHVKELVGHEMSPALYPILFDQIKAIVEKFFDQQGQVRSLLFAFCKDDCRSEKKLKII